MAEMWSQLGMESDVHFVKLGEMIVPVTSGQAEKKPKGLFERVEI